MPLFPGLLAMPTVLVNAALSLVPDRTQTVRGPDRLAVVSPMYNEEAGAGRAVRSLLAQTVPPDEIAISVNGGTDRTRDVVVGVLEEHGYVRGEEGCAPEFAARLERWHHPARPPVLIACYGAQTAKSEAINNLAGGSLLSSERVLLVDGDTVFDPRFVAAMRDNFYRLRRRVVHGRATVEIEDYALQSGTVTSYLPPGARGSQRVISAARAAEYAFSGVLRRGQVRRVGRGPVFGSSRLFTVVGCGFAARRDVLPVPCDTLTEDHDLTLEAQARPTEIERVSVTELARRGFRLIVDGAELSPAAVLDRDDAVELRRGGNARFVTDAVMYTEDPPHVGGYLTQIERWNGGGLQNVLKRVASVRARRAMSANVRWVVASSQAEDVLGLLLLLLFPVALALSVGGAPFQVPLRALGAWLAIDLFVTLVMTWAGFVRFELGRGHGAGRAWAVASRRTAVCALPFLTLKYLNPLSYVAALSQVVPPFLAARRAERRGTSRESRGVAWQRPTARRLNRRTAGVAASMVGVCLLVFVGVLQIAPSLGGAQADAWRLLMSAPRLDMAAHEGLPVTSARAGAPTFGAGLEHVANVLPGPSAAARVRAGISLSGAQGGGHASAAAGAGIAGGAPRVRFGAPGPFGPPPPSALARAPGGAARSGTSVGTFPAVALAADAAFPGTGLAADAAFRESGSVADAASPAIGAVVHVAAFEVAGETGAEVGAEVGAGGAVEFGAGLASGTVAASSAGGNPASPSLRSPGSGAHVVGAPLVGAPPVGAPLVGVPLVGVPLVGVPLVGVPPVGAPLVGIPPVGAPPVGIPLVGTSQVDTPPVDTRAVGSAAVATGPAAGSVLSVPSVGPALALWAAVARLQGDAIERVVDGAGATRVDALPQNVLGAGASVAGGPAAGASMQGGERAGAPAVSAPVSSARLSSARLSSARLSSARLSSARLSSAPLSSAPVSIAPVSSAPTSRGSAPTDPASGGSVPSGPASSGSAVAGSEPAASRSVTGGALSVSRYCQASFVPAHARAPRRLEGSASEYRPLGPWELLMLARLAPLEPLVVEAATAYDVSPRFLLQVLVNESYLDPLAVGRTGDKGLSQMTSDALTLLGAVSADASSPLHNEHLLRGAFSVFDPDFSICAGAAKLAWAARQPGAAGEAEAYALYINPLRGLDGGRVSAEHRPAVDAMLELAPLLTRLGEVYAVYDSDPARLAPFERELVDVSRSVELGTIALPEAYRRSLGVVRAAELDDRAMYVAVLERLFPTPRADAAP